MIAPMSNEHVDDVARLHCASLTGLVSELGVRAARAFYAGCVRSGSARGFVFLEDSDVRGFVLGSAHPASLKQEVLRANPVGTVVGLCVGIARRPVSLLWLFRSVRGPDEGTYDGAAAELTYLAVASNRRSSGVGRHLVDRFTSAMRDAGVSAYELSVDEGNQTAIGFYEKLGFRLQGRYREFGIVHRRYRLEIDAG
jgi:ribosomal protein S18 acetylase RimI-like enzyme